MAVLASRQLSLVMRIHDDKDGMWGNIFLCSTVSTLLRPSGAWKFFAILFPNKTGVFSGWVW